MFRSLTFFLICLIGIEDSRAEIGLSAGARAGFNISTLRKYEVADGFKRRVVLGSNIAAVLRIDFNKYISLQTEIEFSQKGQGWKRSQDSARFNGKFVVNYVQFPILAVGRFGNEKVKGIIQLGPYVSYWAGAYTQNSVTIDKQSKNATTEKYAFSKNDMRVDVGLVTGVGADVKVGKGWIEVGARYNTGFMNLAKKNSGLPKSYNSSFCLSVAYLYTFK